MIALGKFLIQQEPAPVFLFLSHIPLDHIKGIPYFAPFWKPEWKVHMFAGFLDGHCGGTAYLKRHIAPPPLFPISFTSFPAQILLQDISAYTTVPRPGFEVTTFPLNHPGGALGYRLNFQHYVML